MRSVFFQMGDHISVLPESPRCKVDLEHMLGIVGIVGTVLNLLVVVLVYVYTPVWQGYWLLNRLGIMNHLGDLILKYKEVRIVVSVALYDSTQVEVCE